MKAKKCFLFFDEFFEYIEQMTGDETKQYLMALADYHYKGTIAQFEDRFLQSSFMKSVKLISASEEIYKAKVERMNLINERRKARLKAASGHADDPTPEPKAVKQPKPQPVPEPQPIEPTPEPTPPPSYEPFFQQPEEPQPQQTETEPKPEPPKPNEPPTYTNAKVGDILVMNGKRVVKRTNGVFVIPTLEEVTAYINEKGYHFQANTFLEYYENSKPHPWHMANGNPVKAWKQCCTTFEQHIYLSEGKRAMARQQSPPNSHAHDNINEKVYEPY